MVYYNNLQWVSRFMLNERIDATYYNNEGINYEKKLLKSDMKKVKMSEVASLITQGPNPIFIDDKTKIPCLKTRNVYDEYITFEQCNYISCEEYEKYKKFNLHYGDILVSILGEGSIGKSNIYTYEKKALFNRPIGLIRLKDNVVDKFYVSIFLRSIYGKSFFERGISGSSGQKVLSIEYLKNIKLPIPSPEIQKCIGDKARKAEQLREEAKRLKKDAEKILKQNMNFGNEIFGLHAGKLEVGVGYKKKSIFVNSKRINDRIDAKFYQPELIEIVKMIEKHGFVVLKDMLDFYDTGMSQLEYSDEGYNVISTGTIKNEYLGNIEKFTKKKIPKNKLVDKQDVLMTTYGATSIGKTDIYNIEDGRTTFDYTLFRMKFKKEYPPYFMTYILRCIFVQKQIKYAINSGGGTNYINNDVILNLKIPRINGSIMFDIDELIKEANQCNLLSKQLIQEAKKDIEDLIEGNFDISKLNQS